MNRPWFEWRDLALVSICSALLCAATRLLNTLLLLLLLLKTYFTKLTMNGSRVWWTIEVRKPRGNYNNDCVYNTAIAPLIVRTFLEQFYIGVYWNVENTQTNGFCRSLNQSKEVYFGRSMQYSILHHVLEQQQLCYYVIIYGVRTVYTQCSFDIIVFIDSGVFIDFL